MQVFNGKDFLDSKGCQFDLSNGQTYVVKEIRPEQLDEVMKMPDEPDSKAMTAAIASILDCPPEELKDIGVVELKGVMDFLSENLLS